jgi:hypothetical protein
MPEKCQHPEVTVVEYLYRPATRYEPAEYITTVICSECGASLDMAQLDENTIIHVLGE